MSTRIILLKPEYSNRTPNQRRVKEGSISRASLLPPLPLAYVSVITNQLTLSRFIGLCDLVFLLSKTQRLASAGYARPC